MHVNMCVLYRKYYLESTSFRLASLESLHLAPKADCHNIQEYMYTFKCIKYALAWMSFMSINVCNHA